MANLSESVLLLGPRKALVGIATQPRATGASAASTWAVILNAGIIHRVGPNRLHVDLARAAAELGISAIRVDLSGIGDSDPRTDGLAPLEAALADIREVLDTIAARSAKPTRFVLIGLCSGANHAIITAASDERVLGVALMDPLIPHTARYYFNHFVGRLLRAQSWRNSLRADHRLWRLLGRFLRGKDSQQSRDPGAPDAATIQRFLADVYGRAFRRGVRILAVFTGDLEAQHNYREQIVDALPEVPFGDGLELHYFERADHTFSRADDRTLLISIIVQWLERLG